MRHIEKSRVEQQHYNEEQVLGRYSYHPKMYESLPYPNQRRVAQGIHAETAACRVSKYVSY
jgi:hypothetical protein